MNTYYLYKNKAYTCAITSDIIPRIGESITFNDKQYTVVDVIHNIITDDSGRCKLFDIDVYVK